MDLLVLQRLAGELDEALRGARIEQVYALPRNDVVLVVGRRSDPRLWFSAEPDHPHLYLRRGPHATPKRPPGFAMAARNALRGRRIGAITWAHRDRVIELRCTGDDAVRLVFELIPRRATAMIVDAGGLVSAVWQPRRGRPRRGTPYEPPRPDRRPSIDALDRDAWEALQACVDDEALARGLVRSIAGMSSLVAREIAHRYRTGTPLADAARSELDRAARETTDARVYAPGPLAVLHALPPPQEFVLAPYEMHHATADVEQGNLHASRFATLREAAASYYPLRATLTSLESARVALASALDLAIVRLHRTIDAIADDAVGAGNAEQHRGWADLLLAYPQAQRDGSIVRVPDPWATGGDTLLEIPVDPARSLIDNAQAYYSRARRAERSAERTAERRRRLQGRIANLRGLAKELAATTSRRDCLRIARAAGANGVSLRTEAWAISESTDDVVPVPEDDERDHGPRGAGTGRQARREPGIDRYVSSDGYEILVGRNARANERVTHKLAAPRDFWLHADGPGSHVIIRNPERAEEPSETALGEAASLAAHFSFARGATKVNVHWTQARHVKKPRGAPTGQVTLRRARTYLAEPRVPASLQAATGAD